MSERRIGVRELKSKLSECVREVREGRTIVVTERGRAVARLIPDTTSVRERLARHVPRDATLLKVGQRIPVIITVTGFGGKDVVPGMNAVTTIHIH